MNRTAVKSTVAAGDIVQKIFRPSTRQPEAVRVAVVAGRCFAGNAVIAGCSDLIVATRNSNLGMAGPAMIAGGGLGHFQPEEIGPIGVQTRNGVVDVDDWKDDPRVKRPFLHADTAGGITTEDLVVAFSDGTDADVVGLASDPLEACVRVFHVRDGRIRGERGFIVERVDDADEAQLVATLLAQMYAEPDADVPRRVLVPALPEPEEVVVLGEWLSQRRGSTDREQGGLRGSGRGVGTRLRDVQLHADNLSLRDGESKSAAGH